MTFSVELLTATSPHNHQSVSFPFISLVTIMIMYVVIAYLIIDFVSPEEEEEEEEEENSGSHASVAQGGPSGMSNTELEDLPFFIYRGEAPESCAVCLDGFRTGDMCRIFAVCRHIFHAQCIDHWLLRSRSCPTCRSPFGYQASVDIVCVQDP